MINSQQIVAYGAPLASGSAASPAPSGREALVRVRNCGVCHSDVHLQDGHFNLGDGNNLDISSGRALPFTLGHEVEGEVVALGPDADGISVGDRALVYPWIGCDDCPICARGDGHMCNAPRAVGVNVNGGYADHCLVPDAKYLVPYGDLDPSLAATYACSGITAYGALDKVGPLGDDERVLIIGMGGVGMMGLAFAQALFDAPPLVADIDASKREAALKAGAAEAFDSVDRASAKAIRKMTNGGVAAVVDFVGSDSSFAFADAAVGRGGKIIIVGLIGGRMSLPVPMFPLRSLTITGSYVGSLAQFTDMMALVRDGKVSPIPIQTRSLDRAEQTLNDLRDGRLIGRVVLQP